MAWTSTDADTLRAAIASGIRVVSFGNRSQTYNSVEEMFQALAVIEQSIQGTQAKRTRYAAVDKGA